MKQNTSEGFSLTSKGQDYELQDKEKGTNKSMNPWTKQTN